MPVRHGLYHLVVRLYDTVSYLGLSSYENVGIVLIDGRHHNLLSVYLGPLALTEATLHHWRSQFLLSVGSASIFRSPPRSKKLPSHAVHFLQHTYITANYQHQPIPFGYLSCFPKAPTITPRVQVNMQALQLEMIITLSILSPGLCTVVGLFADFGFFDLFDWYLYKERLNMSLARILGLLFLQQNKNERN
jgi:hypothetical protein